MIMMMPRKEGPRAMVSQFTMMDDDTRSVLRSHPDDLATDEVVDGRKRFKRKRSPTASFPIILYDLLEEADSKGYANTISWLPDGARFQIHNPAKFRDEIMTKYFRQTKLESFTRQLYIYGFSKDVGFKKDDMVFAHQEFERGNIDASRNIGRNQSGDRRKKRKEVKAREPAPMAQAQQLMSNHHEPQNRGLMTTDQLISRNDVLSWQLNRQEGDRNRVGMVGNRLSLTSDTDMLPPRPFNLSTESTASSASNLDLEPRPIEEMIHDYSSRIFKPN